MSGSLTTIRGPLLSSQPSSTNTLQNSPSSTNPGFFGKVGGCISQVFRLLNTEPWLEHGWTYYIYFTLLAEFVKGLFAVFVLSVALDITVRFVQNTEKLYLIQMIFIFAFGMIIILNITFAIVRLSRRYGTHDTYSEAQFSFLVTNLPINSNPDEIKKEFTRAVRQFLRHYKIEGSVKEVILLQECGDYVALKNKQKAIKEKIRKTEESHKKVEQKVYIDLENIEKKMKVIEQERENYEKFIGQAILILDSIKTRNQMMKKLELFWIKSLLLRVKGQMPTFWRIQEPSEMRYNYMHGSFALKFFFTTILQLAISIGVFAAVFVKAQSSVTKGTPWMDSQIGLMLLTAVPMISFKLVKGLNAIVPYFSQDTKYRSYAVHSFVNCAITMFLVNLILSVKNTKAVFTNKIIIGLLTFLGSKVVGYIFTVFMEKCWKKNTNKSSTFDIWSAFNSVYQLIFIGICYLSLSPLAITSLLIVSFFVVIAISGHYIKNYTSQSRLQSFQVGFTLYFVAIIMLFLFNFTLNTHALFPDSYQGVARQYSDKLTIFCEGIVAVLLLVVGYYFRKRNLSEEDIRYEEAKKSFKSFYSEQYPLHHIIKTKQTEIKLAIL